MKFMHQKFHPASAIFWNVMHNNGPHFLISLIKIGPHFEMHTQKGRYFLNSHTQKNKHFGIYMHKKYTFWNFTYKKFLILEFEHNKIHYENLFNAQIIYFMGFHCMKGPYFRTRTLQKRFTYFMVAQSETSFLHIVPKNARVYYT